MAKMFGQEIDQTLVESIEREEKLAAAFFGKNKPIEPAIPILKEDLIVEADPPPPAPGSPEALQAAEIGNQPQ